VSVEPADPGFAAAIRASFARQGMMATLGAEIVALAPGQVSLAAPIRPETGQQHGYAHAGLGWTIGDSAAGYSALSLLPAGWEVLTAEMKTNLLAPAAGRRLVAEGRVIRPGRRLIVVAAELWAEPEDGTRRHVATMLGTMVPLPPAP
jgi:uncharacterized protein (TIGR00369 family)